MDVPNSIPLEMTDHGFPRTKRILNLTPSQGLNQNSRRVLSAIFAPSAFAPFIDVHWCRSVLRLAL